VDGGVRGMTGDEPLAADLPRPDFLMASMGRSGSTMIANWLTDPPGRVVLIEPSLFALRNPNMVRVQLPEFSAPASDAEWTHPDADWQARFRRLFAPRLVGRRWALKEVLVAESRRIMETFAPPRVVVTVRDIGAIAASFLEKHRRQNNRDRFDAGWVDAYCRRESAAMVALCDAMLRAGLPHHVVRYEDFVASEAVRQQLAAFVGWPGGGLAQRHFGKLGRAFEAERHASGISARTPSLPERALEPEELALLPGIVADCAAYQARFGFGPVSRDAAT
jgi:hypothetical protein